MTDFEDTHDSLEALLDGNVHPKHVPGAVSLVEDSVTFTKALWDLLKTQGLDHPSDIPDIQVMEQVIDRMYGELAAACMMFTDNAYAKLPLLFYGAHKKLVNENHPAIPKQLVQGFHDFGTRLENTQKTKAMFKELPKEM